jgi:hypothetical protein
MGRERTLRSAERPPGRKDVVEALVVSVHGPHPPWHWQRFSIALACALCLLASPVAGAAAQSASPSPLWQAYPLDAGKPTGTLPETARGAPAPDGGGGRASDATVRQPDTPAVVTVLFAGALAGVAWIAGAGALRLVRRHRHSETARG